MNRNQQASGASFSSHKHRSTRGAAQLVEFAAALALLLLAVILPLSAVCGLLSSIVTGQYIAIHAMGAVSKAISYDSALAACVENSEAFSHLCTFAHIRPIGGYQRSGADLFIDTRDKLSNERETIGPNAPFLGTIDENNKSYSYRLVVHFSAGPLLPPAAQGPRIDYLNAPVVLNFTATKIVEHPQGLTLCLRPLTLNSQTEGKP